MNIIYRGGYNKHDETSIKTSMFYDYAKEVQNFEKQGGNIVVVTFAKPDGYYDALLEDTLGSLPEIIDGTSKKPINWKKYDLIFLPGGHDLKLKEKLLLFGFSIENLKTNVTIIGDSAGATVMGKEFAWKDEKGNYSIEKGLHPDSNLFVVPHCDNENYVTEEMKRLAKEHCIKNELTLLFLKENEAMLLASNKIADFELADVLSRE